MKNYLFLIVSFLVGTTLYAQVDPGADVARLLQESKTKFPGMRPQIFFSQDKYSPGDTAFFRLFILTEDERILADRYLLTLELVNPEGLIVTRQNVSCAIFGAANQLVLPATIAPGLYEIRLYSDRLTTAYGLSASLMIVGEKALQKSPPKGKSLNIYPEGGHLIPGALNRVIVHAPDIVPVSASLFSNEGKIMPVTFDQDGYASLHFVPLASTSYRVDYIVNEDLLSIPMPSSEPQAVTLRVYPGPRKMYVLDVLSGSEGPKTATLVLVAHRAVVHSQEVRISKEGKGSILTVADFFPEGFSELFVLGQKNQILAYRPIYRPMKSAVSLEVSGIPDVTTIRDSVSVSLKLADSAGNPVLGALALSIIHDQSRIHPLRTPDPSLELRNHQPDIDWMQPADRVEMALMAHPIPQQVIPDYPPLVYNANLNLSGRVYSNDPSVPLPYSSKMIIYLHKDLIPYETPIENDGTFHFPKIYDFMGTDYVFYKVVHSNNKDFPHVRVAWSTNLGQTPSWMGSKFSPTEEADAYGVLRKRKLEVDRSFNFFLGEPLLVNESANLNAALEDEFQHADITVYPREYTPFETMRELILEVVPSLLFRARQKDSLVEVTLKTNSVFVAQRYADGNALYIIDGWMTTDTRYLMSLSPKDILAVKVINDIGKLDRLGNLARNGVLFIQTSIPEITRRDLQSKLHVIEGFSPTLSYTERYPVQKRVPDLRTMLYWNPQISTDSMGVAKFTFRTSDIPGTYWLRLMGTTSTGHIVTIERSFEVKFR